MGKRTIAGFGNFWVYMALLALTLFILAKRPWEDPRLRISNKYEVVDTGLIANLDGSAWISDRELLFRGGVDTTQPLYYYNFEKNEKKILFETAPGICYQDGVLYYIKREVKIDEKGSRTQKWESSANSAAINDGTLIEIEHGLNKQIIRYGVGGGKCIVIDKEPEVNEKQKHIYKDSVCTGYKYQCIKRLEDIGVTIYLSDDYIKNALNDNYIKQIRLHAVYDNGDEKLVSGELVNKILTSKYFPYKSIYFQGYGKGGGVIGRDLEFREVTSPVAAYSEENPDGWDGEVHWVKPGMLVRRNLIRKQSSSYQNSELYLLDDDGKSVLLTVDNTGPGDAKISEDGCIYAYYSHYSEPRTMKTANSFKYINFCK